MQFPAVSQTLNHYIKTPDGLSTFNTLNRPEVVGRRTEPERSLYPTLPPTDSIYTAFPFSACSCCFPLLYANYIKILIRGQARPDDGGSLSRSTTSRASVSWRLILVSMTMPGSCLNRYGAASGKTESPMAVTPFPGVTLTGVGVLISWLDVSELSDTRSCS